MIYLTRRQFAVAAEEMVSEAKVAEFRKEIVMDNRQVLFWSRLQACDHIIDRRGVGPFTIGVEIDMRDATRLQIG
jgi:hypothetical protein